ncbi:hypothetical protein [Paenibacillus macquariensis]|uniref:DUF3139 domain-containing protein n=1 Tax=Paenibacillus macquariensis TaxID=948756 RepID=A0ABY1KCY6_9BACL|nr:hypothetical protein [Paenibacillus macquariensis]MEC0093196.1 hypothetical protein [Paenibacillus macquariensis]OAB35059.1 hypothetical protein PMSM_10765 [Paenibacillus macquariensis subsp. macquariensis]SIR62671.1 hypothetical protein SAMN05421578_12425 [Paenibacillus macquariensis]
MTKKKRWLWIVGVGFIAVILLMVVYVSNIGYSHAKAMYNLQFSDKVVVQIEEQDGYESYLTRRSVDTKNLLIDAMNKDHWTYVTQEGSGYFFQKDNDKAIITSQIWNHRYVIYKVKNDIVNLEH